MSVVGSIPMHFRQRRSCSTVPRHPRPVAHREGGKNVWDWNAGVIGHPGDHPHYFGAGKLPQIGEGLGKGIRNFRKATTKEQDEVDAAAKKLEEKKSEETAEKK